jgi:DNA-binding transcriptional ArsR family regulator
LYKERLLCGGAALKTTSGAKCRDDPRIIELADALKTLSDPNRLRIMCFLSQGEKCVCEVEQELDISQQLSSHHLSVLRDTGFLKARKEGIWSYYSVDGQFMKRVRDLFSRYLDLRSACS